MSQKQRFEQKLTQLIHEQNPPWLSQDAYPVRLVVLTWFEVSRWRWQTEPEGTAERRLRAQTDQSAVWQPIAVEFEKQYRLISVRRSNPENGLSDLYILAYFGHWWVGLQTQVREV